MLWRGPRSLVGWRALMGYELHDFERDVLQRSRQVPVLVDFWAPWCGPCRTLGPVLEKLAAEAAGRWELVKLNTEENQQLALAFEVRSIPAVKLFQNGRVTKEFVGALPEAELRRWLDGALPKPWTPRLEEARAHHQAGRQFEAGAAAAEVLIHEPKHEEARVLVAEARLRDDPARASVLVDGFPETSEFATRAAAIKTLAVILERGTTDAAWPDETVRPRFLESLRAWQAGDRETTLQAVIEVIQARKNYADAAPERLARAIVQLLGVRHPVVDRHYRALTGALYS